MSTKFPSRRAAARYLLAALPALAALAGCDSREIVAPAARSPAGGPEAYLDVAQPALLGSYQIAVPIDNSNASSSYAQWTQTGTTIPDSTWAVVRVSGYIRHYDMCGGSASIGTDLGPLAQIGAARVMVGYQIGSAQALPAGQELPIYPLYVPLGADSSVAEALVFQVQGVNLWTKRVIFYDKCSTGQPAFNLSGSQGLTVTQVPRPLKVTGPSTLASGQTGTYTAQVIGNFRIKKSTIRWQFTLADTLAAEQRYGSGFTRDIPACDTVMVCTYKPDLSGRMGVKADIETAAGVTDKGDVTWVGGPQLQLSCTPSVVRGAVATCGASATPSTATLVVTKWQFSGQGVEMSPPPGDPQNSAASWSGPMAVGGTVTVSATVAGRPLTKSAVIAVTPRTWNFSVTAVDSGSWKLPAHPVRLGELGRAELRQPAELQVVTINEGPNTGWQFLDPFSAWPVAISINSVLSDPNSGWYQAQAGRCTATQIEILRARARLHEGIITLPEPVDPDQWNPHDSHVKVWQDYFDQTDVESHFESIVERQQPLSVLAADVSSAMSTYIAGDQLQKDMHWNRMDDSTSNGAITVPCDINWEY